MKSQQEITQKWYEKYYQKTGSERNDLLKNPEVLFQYFGVEDSVISALRRAKLDRATAKILDVGCGVGASLTRFIQLGFTPQNLYGIDIIAQRINEAEERYPNLHFICDDASSMPYEMNSFDLVLESTMFVQITDSQFAKNIADEMLRVTKPLGYILLIDWRYSKPGNSDYLGLSKKRIQELFFVGRHSKILCQTNGALIPPIGRIVSKYVPSVYFLLKAILPVLAGQNSTLIQKCPD